MSSADELEMVILDALRDRSFHGQPEQWDLQGAARNPVCADFMQFFLDLKQENLVQQSWLECRGCAVSRAAGALVRAALVGEDLDNVAALTLEAIQKLHGDEPQTSRNLKNHRWDNYFGFLELVKPFPLRHGCALLPWKALEVLKKERI